MLPVLIALIPIAIGLAVGIPWGLSIRNKRNALVQSGNMLNRPYNFYKQKNVFRTCVTDASQLLSVLDANWLSSQGIAFEYRQQNGMLVFSNKSAGGSFVSSLDSIGYNKTANAYLYEYQFRKWTPSGSTGSVTPADAIGANIVLTALEQAFLRLDYNAVVERTFAEFNTKTSFI